MSLTEINKLGDRIAESKGQVSGEDLEALQAYRQTFKEPILSKARLMKRNYTGCEMSFWRLKPVLCTSNCKTIHIFALIGEVSVN